MLFKDASTGVSIEMFNRAPRYLMIAVGKSGHPKDADAAKNLFLEVTSGLRIIGFNITKMETPAVNEHGVCYTTLTVE